MPSEQREFLTFFFVFFFSFYNFSFLKNAENPEKLRFIINSIFVISRDRLRSLTVSIFGRGKNRRLSRKDVGEQRCNGGSRAKKDQGARWNKSKAKEMMMKGRNKRIVAEEGRNAPGRKEGRKGS